VRNPFAPLRVAIGALLLVVAGFILLGADGWGPPALNESPIGEASRWCERVSAGFFREPVNTLGNLGFVISGLAMLWVLGRDAQSGREAKNPFLRISPIVLLYLGVTIFLGPGSMAMHGTHTRVGAWIDNVSMVAFILIPWLYNLSRLGRWSARALFTTYGVLLVAYAVGYWFLGPDLGIGLDLFGLSIALWIISETVYRWHSTAARAVSGLVGFAVAAAFGLTPGWRPS